MGASRATLVVLAGCYAPSPTTGAPCDERMACPSDQVCIDGRCQPPGTQGVDAPVNELDAALDASPDAPVMLGPWSAPTAIGILPGIAKGDPSATPDRLTIVYGRADDLFIATRPAIGGMFTIAPLTALNSPVVEKSPEITPDGRTIYFASNPDGDYDVFVSTLVGGTWTTPLKVPNWDTASSEQDVAIAPDELTAFIAIGGELRRATRSSKAQAWPAPVSVNVTWGTNPAAPSINSAGDVYFHAGASRDLFVARRNGNGYAAPVPVTELNTTGRDAAPFVSANDRHLMFERDAELVESSR